MTSTKIQNRLTQLFATPQRNLLNIYCTAAYPQLEDTGRVITALSDAGVDIIELGIPFSDPLADGETIQLSGAQALKNGMTLRKLFEQVAEVRKTVDTPLLLMGYINSAFRYGMEAFCAKCAEVGVDGVILPDLPLEVYLEEYQDLFAAHNLSNIFLITPQTSEARIRLIDTHSTGFIYAVSSASTTGTKATIGDATAYLQRIEQMQLQTSVLTGFNIRDRASFEQAAMHTNGGIIGSAFIRALAASENIEQAVQDFVQSIR